MRSLTSTRQTNLRTDTAHGLRAKSAANARAIRDGTEEQFRAFQLISASTTRQITFSAEQLATNVRKTPKVISENHDEVEPAVSDMSHSVQILGGPLKPNPNITETLISNNHTKNLGRLVEAKTVVRDVQDYVRLLGSGLNQNIDIGRQKANDIQTFCKF